jgi:hypothetical protein
MQLPNVCFTNCGRRRRRRCRSQTRCRRGSGWAEMAAGSEPGQWDERQEQWDWAEDSWQQPDGKNQWSDEHGAADGSELKEDGCDSGAASSSWNPPSGRSTTRRTNVSLEERLDLAAERAIAEQLGLKWGQRGPPGPPDGGPKTWRGQPYKELSGKWGKRGGVWKEYYAEKYGKGKGKGKAKTKPRPDPHTVFALWKHGTFPDGKGGGGINCK